MQKDISFEGCYWSVPNGVNLIMGRKHSLCEYEGTKYLNTSYVSDKEILAKVQGLHCNLLIASISIINGDTYDIPFHSGVWTKMHTHISI